MKFEVIGVAIAAATLVAVVAFVSTGYGAAAGISLVAGMMLSGIFRFLAEMKGGAE
jgi:hypothetical protein